MFLSIPAGKVPVRFGWPISRRDPRANANDLLEGKLEHLFTLEHTQTVEILPATKENVAAALRILETMFREVDDRLKERADYFAECPDNADDFVQSITGCRHKEFVPLLLRAMNRLPSARLRERLVGAVYESCSTPAEGFTVLADYLAATDPAAGVEVFDYWTEEESNHKRSAGRLKALKEWKKREFKWSEDAEFAEWQWNCLIADEEAWQTSKRHRDVRLTKDQVTRSARRQGHLDSHPALPPLP